MIQSSLDTQKNPSYNEGELVELERPSSRTTNFKMIHREVRLPRSNERRHRVATCLLSRSFMSKKRVSHAARVFDPNSEAAKEKRAELKPSG